MKKKNFHFGHFPLTEWKIFWEFIKNPVLRLIGRQAASLGETAGVARKRPEIKASLLSDS